VSPFTPESTSSSTSGSSSADPVAPRGGTSGGAGPTGGTPGGGFTSGAPPGGGPPGAGPGGAGGSGAGGAGGRFSWVTRRRKLWGGILVPAGTSAAVNWDTSAGLFTPAGKAMILAQATPPGDGNFTLYVIGSSGTYQFNVTNGVLALVIDAGV